MRSFSYLASGQVSQDVRSASQTYTFAANDNGRNASAALNGTTAGAYLYNAFERRVQKTASSAVTQFVFDRFGHLLEEANASGAVQKEYIWLDDLPVAVVDDTGTAPVLYYIQTDQLGTPQKITDANANVVWDGVFDPFGNAQSASNGGGVWDSSLWDNFLWGATLSLNNLRFPGQYADAETALNQSWFRDYDPTIGRYIQSDPIGISAGTNTYIYSQGNPINLTDLLGLCQQYCQLPNGQIVPYNDLGNGFASVPAGDNGMGFAIGAEATGAGMPTVGKPGGIAGGGASGPVTSPASGILRGMTGEARFAPLTPFTGTPSVGGSIGRALPIIGPIESFLNFLKMMNGYQNAIICRPFT